MSYNDPRCQAFNRKAEALLVVALTVVLLGWLVFCGLILT